ncbi:MAG: hypothetical protein MI700_09640 [Balneolales bacterium]|nr:hypothetical protein [Balneolales bacterium]
MKTLIKTFATFSLALILVGGIFAQTTGELQFIRPTGKAGLNVFETPKTNDVPFDGMVVKVGGDFAMQFQALVQDGDSAQSLTDLANNFSLPTANLNIDVQLADGFRMHLRTYLSSRHHAEAWVKGGHIQIDNLNFIQEGLAEDFMKNFRIRVGMDDINYGDTHFRRSDNSAAIYNPFVGNYIMDSFTTEPFMEFTYMADAGILAVLGATNGRLNQEPSAGDDGFVVYGKVGYDSQINDDLRFRLTGSFYNSSNESTRDYLYGGDRAGSRYYNILTGSDFDGRFNPQFSGSRTPVADRGYLTAFQINPFIKFQGLEYFGVFELISNDDAGGSFTQIGSEVLYRLGEEENFYLGGRYNLVTGEQLDGAESLDISRINIGAGWFMTDNVLTKVEYVTQTYGGDGWIGTLYEDAEFNGLVIEAIISF